MKVNKYIHGRYIEKEAFPFPNIFKNHNNRWKLQIVEEVAQ